MFMYVWTLIIIEACIREVAAYTLFFRRKIVDTDHRLTNLWSFMINNFFSDIT